MGIPNHFTCLLRNLYAGQEATVRTGHGAIYWFQIGKGVHQGCTLDINHSSFLDLSTKANEIKAKINETSVRPD